VIGIQNEEYVSIFFMNCTAWNYMAEYDGYTIYT